MLVGVGNWQQTWSSVDEYVDMGHQKEVFLNWQVHSDKYRRRHSQFRSRGLPPYHYRSQFHWSQALVSDTTGRPVPHAVAIKINSGTDWISERMLILVTPELLIPVVFSHCLPIHTTPKDVEVNLTALLFDDRADVVKVDFVCCSCVVKCVEAVYTSVQPHTVQVPQNINRLVLVLMVMAMRSPFR